MLGIGLFKTQGLDEYGTAAVGWLRGAGLKATEGPAEHRGGGIRALTRTLRTQTKHLRTRTTEMQQRKTPQVFISVKKIKKIKKREMLKLKLRRLDKEKL